MFEINTKIQKLKIIFSKISMNLKKYMESAITVSCRSFNLLTSSSNQSPHALRFLNLFYFIKLNHPKLTNWSTSLKNRKIKQEKLTQNSLDRILHSLKRWNERTTNFQKNWNTPASLVLFPPSAIYMALFACFQKVGAMGGSL